MLVARRACWQCLVQRVTPTHRHVVRPGVRSAHRHLSVSNSHANTAADDNQHDQLSLARHMLNIPTDEVSIHARLNGDILACRSVRQLTTHYIQSHVDYNDVNYVTWYVQHSKLINRHKQSFSSIYDDVCRRLIQLVSDRTSARSRSVVSVMHAVSSTQQPTPRDMHVQLYSACVTTLLDMLQSSRTFEKISYVQCLVGVQQWTVAQSISQWDGDNDMLVRHVVQQIDAIRHVYDMEQVKSILRVMLNVYSRCATVSTRGYLIYLINDCLSILQPHIAETQFHELVQLYTLIHTFADHDKLNTEAFRANVLQRLDVHAPVSVSTSMKLWYDRTQQLDAIECKQLTILCRLTEQYVAESFSHYTSYDTTALLLLQRCSYTSQLLLSYLRKYAAVPSVRIHAPHILYLYLYNVYTRGDLTSEAYKSLQYHLLQRCDLSLLSDTELQQVYQCFVQSDTQSRTLKQLLKQQMQVRGLHTDIIEQPPAHVSSSIMAIDRIRQSASVEDARQMFIDSVSDIESQCKQFAASQCVAVLHDIDRYGLMNASEIVPLFDVCYDRTCQQFDRLTIKQVMYVIDYCQRTDMMTFNKFERLVSCIHNHVNKYNWATVCDLMYYTAHWPQYQSKLYHSYCRQSLDRIKQRADTDRQLHLGNSHINLLILAVAAVKLRPIKLVQQLLANTAGVLHGQLPLKADEWSALVSSVHQLVFQLNIKHTDFTADLQQAIRQGSVIKQLDLQQLAVISEVFAELGHVDEVYWQQVIGLLNSTAMQPDTVGQLVPLYYAAYIAGIRDLQYDRLLEYVCCMSQRLSTTQTNTIKLYKLAQFVKYGDTLPDQVVHTYTHQYHDVTLSPNVADLFAQLHSPIHHNVFDEQSGIFFRYFINVINSDYLVQTDDASVQIVTPDDLEPFRVTMTVLVESNEARSYDIQTGENVNLIYQSDVIEREYWLSKSVYVCVVDLNYLSNLIDADSKLMYVRTCLVNAVNANTGYQFGD